MMNRQIEEKIRLLQAKEVTRQAEIRAGHVSSGTASTPELAQLQQQFQQSYSIQPPPRTRNYRYG